MSNDGDRILITGGQSMLAGYLGRIYGAKADRLSRAEVDICDAKTLHSTLASGKYRVLINTAGSAAGERNHLFQINAFCPAELARVCGQHNIAFIFLSSGRVFDGVKREPYLESDGVNPLDDYGMSKYTGERLVENELFDKPYYIFRLPQVLGVRKGTTAAQGINRLIHQAVEGEPLLVSHNLVGTPAYGLDIAHMIHDAIESGLPHGLYHLATSGRASLYELVTFICRQMNIETTIRPVDHAYFQLPGRRASNLALASNRLPIGRRWEESISAFTEELKKSLDG